MKKSISVGHKIHTFKLIFSKRSYVVYEKCYVVCRFMSFQKRFLSKDRIELHTFKEKCFLIFPEEAMSFVDCYVA